MNEQLTPKILKKIIQKKSTHTPNTKVIIIYLKLK